MSLLSSVIDFRYTKANVLHHLIALEVYGIIWQAYLTFIPLN